MSNVHGVNLDDIKFGDKVHVECEVIYKEAPLIQVQTLSLNGWIDYVRITKHIPKPKPEPKIGDPCSLKNGRQAIIKGISDDGQQFWLKVAGGMSYTTRLKEQITF